MKKYKQEKDLQDELVEDIEEFDEDIEGVLEKDEDDDDKTDVEDDDEEDEEDMDESVEDDGLAAAEATVAAIKASAKKKQKEPKTSASDAKAKMEAAFKDDLDALVESEATLSEGFRAKASVIFEAALTSKISETVDRLEAEYADALTEETASIKEDLVEKVDGYLNYVVETWMEDNTLEVEKGIRTEIAESFIDSLQVVFKEHYVEVPEGKVDLVDELSNKVGALEEDYNAEIARSIVLKEENAKLVKEQVIRESSIGLSESEIEKLKSLVEDVAFDNAEAFVTKVQTLKESYFKTTIVSNDEEELNEASVDVSGSMSRYVAALKTK
tara:strand:+ start:7509 stop:8492 length:984 start_codon:yes stop_codon:yes gene_type:complete